MGKRMRVQRDLGSDDCTVLPPRTTTSAAPKRQRRRPAANCVLMSDSVQYREPESYQKSLRCEEAAE